MGSPGLNPMRVSGLSGYGRNIIPTISVTLRLSNIYIQKRRLVMRTIRNFVDYFCLVFLMGFMGSCHTAPPEMSNYEGVWTSLGLGTVLHIQGASYQFYDVMDSSCVPRRKGPISDFEENLRLSSDTLKMEMGINTYYYIRSRELPSFCTAPISNPNSHDPLYNFEIFAQTIASHYAFFDLNQISWDSLYQQQKSKLNRQSSDAELYVVLEETFALLNDNHAFLEAPDDVYEQLEANQPANAQPIELEEYGDFQIANLVADHYLVEDLTKDSWLIKWGKMENNIGYVQIKAMWLYADLNLPDSLVKANGLVDTYVDAFHQLYEGAYIEKEIAGASKVMDKVMEDLWATDAMVLDVRFNGGGQDAVSHEILHRFNGQKTTVATQKLRYGGNHYSPITPVYLKAADNPYLKPVFVLTSPQTGSAAESFALSTLSMPHIQRIGSHTAGALSTSLEKKLPNGWDFALSNEIFTAPNGRYYENIGVPADHELHYPDDRQTFFRYIANHLEKDKQQILDVIHKLLPE